MGDGKGKARASSADDLDGPHTSDRPPQASNSLAERVLTSATGLAQSAFTAPSSNELADRASSVLASAGKGQPAGNNADSACAESYKSTLRNDSSSAQAQASTTFRSHHDEHIANAEAEFSTFLDGIDSFNPSVTFEGNASTSMLLGGALAENEDQAGRVATAPVGYPTVQEQQAHDGESVSAILSDPTISLFEETDIYRQQEDEPVTWNLTPSQRAQWQERLQADYPAVELHTVPDASHPLNLLPQLDTPQDGTKEMWIAQWENILTRYTDEVWGDLLPLVREAREEVKTIEEEDPTPGNGQPKALRRLGLVLGHLRGG